MRLAVIVAILALCMASVSVALAFTPGDNASQTPIAVANTTATDKTNVVWPVKLSTQGMIDTGTISSSALDAHMIQADTGQPYMPGTGQIAVAQYWLFDYNGGIGPTYTDYTTQANSGVADSVPLIDGTPEANDAVLIGLYHRSQVIRFNVTTAAVGTLTFSASYCKTAGCNPSTSGNWAALPSPSPTILGFTSVGLAVQQYTLTFSNNDWTRLAGPAAAAPSGVGGVSAYWVRLLLTTYSATANPKLSQVWGETAQWFGFSDSIPAVSQLNYTLYTQGASGSAADLTYHQYFPGPTGVTTADNAGLEPGSDYQFDISGWWDTDSVGTNRCAISKASAVSLCVLSVGNVRFANNGASANCDFALPTGEHDVVITYTGAGVTTYEVDGGGASNCAAGMPISNSANAWAWVSDGTSGALTGSMEYTNWIREYVASSLVLEYQLTSTPGTTFADSSGGGHDATLMSMPFMPQNVTLTLSPTSAITPADANQLQDPPAALPAVTPQPTGDGSSSSLPGYAIVQSLTQGSSQLPIQALYVAGGGAFLILLTVMAYTSSGNNMLVAVSVALVVGAFLVYFNGGAGIISFGAFAMLCVVGLGLLSASRKGVF